MPETDPIPIWRYYWIATLPDGRQIPQFDAAGKKFLWHDLPDKPVKITLVPFDKTSALKVRAVSKVAALPVANLPIEMDDLGGGLVSGIDERFHMQPTVKCLTCGHEFPYTPAGKAECPACHAHDDWFCADCQQNKEPLIINNQCICPSCKSQGRTRGLKRIKKFQISAQGTRYDFQHWIRSGDVEVRATRDGIKVSRYVPPPPSQPEDTAEPSG